MQQVLDFLKGPQGPIAVVALVILLGFLVSIKYLIRAGGPGVSRSRSAAASRSSGAAKKHDGPAPSARTGAAGQSSAAAADDDDDDDGSKAVRRTRRYA